MNKELTKDGPYYLYKGIRIFKRSKGGFSFTYFAQLPNGNFSNGNSYPDTLARTTVKIDEMMQNWSLTEVKNYNLYLIRNN